MTSRARVSGVFVGLEALAALGMLALSVHGPDGLSIAAPLYLVTAVGFTWWMARRAHSAWAVAATGVLMLAAAPGVVALLDQLERLASERRVAATRVSDVRDEVIRSEGGRPVGVRLTYTVSAPEGGYVAILPSLYSRDPGTTQLRLHALRWTIDGHSEPTSLARGTPHEIDVELYPPLVAIARGERCLVAVSVPPLPDTVVASPLRIIIFGSPYGRLDRGGREEVTRGRYDLAELYRGVLAERWMRCDAGEAAPK